MMRSKKSPVSGPAGTQSGGRGRNRSPRASKRYTPPIPMSMKRSGRWLAVLLFSLLGIGFVMIFLNYLGVLPGGASNWYLLGGLVFLSGGFFAATKYR